MAILGDDMTSYSIAEAKDHFAEIVHEAEQRAPVEITRRGRPVAVLLSIDDYRRLQSQHHVFVEAYNAFRQRHDLAQLAIEPSLFEDTRSTEPGRPIEL